MFIEKNNLKVCSWLLISNEHSLCCLSARVEATASFHGSVLLLANKHNVFLANACLMFAFSLQVLCLIALRSTAVCVWWLSFSCCTALLTNFAWLLSNRKSNVMANKIKDRTTCRICRIHPTMCAALMPTQPTAIKDQIDTVCLMMLRLNHNQVETAVTKEMLGSILRLSDRMEEYQDYGTNLKFFYFKSKLVRLIICRITLFLSCTKVGICLSIQQKSILWPCNMFDVKIAIAFASQWFQWISCLLNLQLVWSYACFQISFWDFWNLQITLDICFMTHNWCLLDNFESIKIIHQSGLCTKMWKLFFDVKLCLR